MSWLTHAPEVVLVATLVFIHVMAKRERREKELLIEESAVLRRALKESSQELYCASAQLSHSRKNYAAKCASEAADAARKAAKS